MGINNKKFIDFFYKSYITILITLSIIFIFLSKKLNESFFAKFSIDKILKQSTIQKINYLQLTSKILSIIFLILAITSLFYQKRIKYFII
jgi:hypothetical protein